MSTAAKTTQTTQVYQVFILATPEQIWDAITKPEFTERYFHGVHIEVRDGRRFSAVGDVAWDEEVIESDPPRRLVHQWISGYDPELAAEEPSRLTWEIKPQEDGQLEGAPKTAQGVSGTGWMFVLSNLKTLLETGKPLSR
jgi:uncharacterized protein YndB with AHSA1/START domain